MRLKVEEEADRPNDMYVPFQQTNYSPPPFCNMEYFYYQPLLFF